MSYEVWGEPDDLPELPEGCWDEDTVDQVQSAIRVLCAEPVYEGGKKENGISVRFLARMTLLRSAARLVNYNDPLVRDAEREIEAATNGKRNESECPYFGPNAKLTSSDIERYAARRGDDPHRKLGVLLAVVEMLMSEDKWLRDITKKMLREWAGGATPAEVKP